MKRGKTAALVAAALVAGLVLGTMGTAVAAPAQVTSAANGFGAICRQAGGTIADIVAKLTGKTVEDVYAARAEGDSFADIASATGVTSDKLTDEVLAARKAALDDAVKAGTITQAQEDAAIANMQTRVSATIVADAPATCTGEGPGTGAGCGAGAGAGFGRGAGAGGGRGAGRGAGACGALGTTQQ